MKIFINSCRYRLLNFIIISLSLVILSCSAQPAYHRLYSGPALSKEEIAFIVTPRNNVLTSGIYIDSVDGEPVKGSNWDNTINIELLPGHHTFQIGFIEQQSARKLFYTGTAKASYYKAFEFLAEAGHMYEIGVDYKPKMNVLTPFGVAVKPPWKPMLYDVTNTKIEVPIEIIETNQEPQEFDKPMDNLMRGLFGTH